jgi:Protein of unknown function (DUF4239)
MSALSIAAIVFATSFAAALLGMLLHAKLPDHHLTTESKDVVKLVMGLIATMAALVLSLLIASANSTYNTQRSELESVSANIVLLDRLLVFYGPDAKDTRDALHVVVQATHDLIWPPKGGGSATLDPRSMQRSATAFITRLQSLTPKNDAERGMQTRALQLSETIGQTRLLMYEQLSGGVSWPFLTVLVFWICMLFLGFGLLTHRNGTITVALLIGTLSVSGAVFLIFELNSPYQGLLQMSDAPLRDAITEINP